MRAAACSKAPSCTPISLPYPEPQWGDGTGEGNLQLVWHWGWLRLGVEPGQCNAPCRKCPPFSPGASLGEVSVLTLAVIISLAHARLGLSGYPRLYGHGACAHSATTHTEAAGTCPEDGQGGMFHVSRLLYLPLYSLPAASGCLQMPAPSS